MSSAIEQALELGLGDELELVARLVIWRVRVRDLPAEVAPSVTALTRSGLFAKLPGGYLGDSMAPCLPPTDGADASRAASP